MQTVRAGLPETTRDVSGQADALLDAVCCVLAAGDSATVQTYARHTGQETKELKIAVIIQEMVTPRRPSQDLISGVAFSKNPLTLLDGVVVEAVHGCGEQLVQSGKTPARWVFKWGNWLTQPETGSIGLALIELVVRQTQQIAQRFGVPVDLEWVFDGEQLYWVQLRPITCLESINIYSNRIAREVFPGLIKPLIWSVNVPLVNGAWIRLFTEMIGPNDLGDARMLEIEKLPLAERRKAIYGIASD